MSNNNIIILEHEPYSPRKNNHYHINRFFDEGWNVEYWALNKALDYVKNVKYTYEDYESYVKYYDDIKEVLLSIKKFDKRNTIFIIEMSLDFSNLSIFKLLKSGGYKWVSIDYYFNPTTYLSPIKTLQSQVLETKLKDLPRKLKRFFFNSMFSKLNIPDILFLTGNNLQGARVASKIESLDYFDIEDYTQNKNSDPLLPFKYILFLDIMLVNHPDFKRMGIDKMIDENEYFSKMSDFFDEIEKQSGLPVVIASHPKANYTNEFGNRLCLKDKTAQLSIHSEMVLTHGSLSISFALFSRKPLMYIYSEELFYKKKRFETLLYRMRKASSLLGASLINMDNFKSNERLCMHVDVAKYEFFLDLLYRNCNKLEVGSNFDVIRRSFVKLLDKNNM